MLNSKEIKQLSKYSQTISPLLQKLDKVTYIYKRIRAVRTPYTIKKIKCYYNALNYDIKRNMFILNVPNRGGGVLQFYLYPKDYGTKWSDKRSDVEKYLKTL